MIEPGWTSEPMGICVPEGHGFKMGEIIEMEVPIDPLDGWPKPGHPRAVLTKRQFVVMQIGNVRAARAHGSITISPPLLPKKQALPKK